VVCGLLAPILPDGSRWWPSSVGGGGERLIDGSVVGGGLLFPIRPTGGRGCGHLLFCLIKLVPLGPSSAKMVTFLRSVLLLLHGMVSFGKLRQQV
jgi:hypothetical protein